VGFFCPLTHKETNMNETLQEYADSRGLPIRAEREQGIIRGVKILGARSRNGRTYLADAMSQAAPLYEGAKVNVNHPKGTPPGPRNYQDRIGVIRNVTARADEGLFGDFHFNPKHALAEQLLWDAEHAPQNVGFSHNVQARTARRGDTVVVEAITQVQSVDLVADPATTRGLFESAIAADQAVEDASQAELLLESLTADRLREGRRDLVEELLAEPRKQIAQLQEEVEQFRAAENARNRRQKVLQLLAECEPPGQITPDQWQRCLGSDSFVETLIHAEDEAAMHRLIDERVELVREITGCRNDARPVSREQNNLLDQPPRDVEAFVRSIS
jgi:hypothetical protein